MHGSFRPFFVLVALVVAVISTPGCSCNGESDASPFVAPSGEGTHATNPSQLTAKIVATPRAIPKNDNFATTVTLDGSSSQGAGAPLAYQWDIGNGKLVSGTLTSPRIAASFDGKDNAPVTLTIKDGTVSNAAATVIGIQSPPIAVVQQEYSTDTGLAVILDGSLSFDRDGDPLTFAWSSTGGSSVGTATITDAGQGKASFTADLAGDYTVVLKVTAGGVSAQARTRVHVFPSAAMQFPYEVAVTATPAVAPVGAPVSFTITLTEPVTPNMTVTLRAGAMTIPVSGLTASATFPSTGDYPVIADVTSPGRGGRARAPLQVYDPGVPDNGGPQVSVTSPTSGTRLSETVDVSGSVTSNQLAAYYIEERLTELKDPERWTQLYKGTSPVPSGKLGPIPFELLRQGTHDIRVRAVDTRGHEASATTKVIVDGGNPRGPVRFVLTDYYAGWAGPVVQIRRAYDSFDHVVRDFGYGWTMDSSGSGSVTQTNPVGAGWTPPPASTCIFGGGQGDELQDHTITVTAGTQASLYVPELVQSSCITGARIMNLRFVQVGGSGAATMEMDGQGQDFFLTESGSTDPNAPGNRLYFFDASDQPTTPYSPKGWTITTADNNKMKYQDNALVQTRDAYGNGTDISPDKIVHTSGSTISIERNGDKLVTGVIRPDGKKRTYEYNSAKELIAASDFDGRRWRYFYGSDHVLSTIVGPRGDVKSAQEYDDQGRFTAVQQGTDAPETVTYDTANRKDTTIHGSDKSVDVSAYDPSGNTIARDINGTPIERFVVDKQNKVAAAAEAIGTTTAKYGTDGVQSINPHGYGEMGLGRDSKGWVNQVTTPAGTIAYERDANGKMTRTTGGGTDVQLTRDNTGKVAVLNVNGATTNYVRNSTGYLTAVEQNGTRYNYDINDNGDIVGLHYMQNGDKVDVTMTVDQDAVPLTSTTMVNGTMFSQSSVTQDAEGNIATSASGQRVVLDSRGRPQHLIEGTGADTAVISKEYDSAGHLVATTSSEGARQTFTVDPMTGAQVTTSSTGLTKQAFRDATGNVTKEIKPGGLATTYEYSATGKKTATHYPDGRTETWAYDAKDRVTKHGFAEGTVEAYTYDEFGNIATKTQGASAPWKFTYTGPKVTKTVAPSGITVDTNYTADGQLASIQYEGGPPAAVFEYDGKTLKSISDPAGHVRRFSTARLGTVLTQTWPSGATATTENRTDGSRVLTNFDGHAVTVTFDAKGNLTSQKADDGTMATAAYNRDGHIAAYTDSSGTTSFARDTVGRLLTMTRGDGRYIRIDNDPAFGYSTVTTPGGKNSYTYDDKGRLTALSVDDQSSIAVSYDSGGYKSSLALGGLTVSSSRNDLGRVSNVSVAYNGKALLNDAVAYDGIGHPTSVTPMAGTGTTRQFEYDAAERLTKDSDVTYKYDNSGNIVGIGSRALTFDVDDHVLTSGSENFTSDKSGHLLSIAGGRDAKFTWDGLGRLVTAVVGGQTVTYGYDAQGLLVSRKADNDNRAFLWTADDSNPLLLEEYDPTSGELRARNTYLDRLVVRTVGAHRYTFVNDAFQNARIVVDENGAVVDTRDFSAYGVPRSGTIDLDKPFGFGGAWTDPVTGFVYMHARWYMPELGRFMSEDLADSIPQAPTTINRFQYGNDEPTVFFDPSGKQLADVCMAMFGYGSLSRTYNFRVINTGFSVLSQLTALVQATVAIDKSGIFKFAGNNHRLFPTSFLMGLNLQVGALGIGADAGIEGLLHFGTNNFNGTMTPYVYAGGVPTLYVPGKGWVNPSADIAEASSAEKCPSCVLPPGLFSGGYVGGQAFITAGVTLYGGFAWDVIHPGAYTGAFESFSAPAPLFVPIVTLYAMLQLDAGGQLAGAGLGGAGAGVLAGTFSGLSTIGANFLSMMGAFFGAVAAGNANPGQIWNNGPPSSNLLGQQANKFWDSVTKWAEGPTYSIAFSPSSGPTNLCQRDAMGNWLDKTCVEAQAWSLTRNIASAGTTGWSGWGGASNNWNWNWLKGGNAAVPVWFQYKFDMYYCAWGGAPGPDCDTKMDIAVNYGPLPPNPLASVKP